VFPLKDDIRPERIPVVNFLMIGLCVFIFVMQMNDPGGLVQEYGMIPARVSHPDATLVHEREQTIQTPRGLEVIVVEETIPPSPWHAYTTILSCVFLHGSLMHLIGNIWFLYVFGDNVEDRMGHFGYLCFYLGSGIAASLTHYAFQPESAVPTIGASGAVAGVMGAYLWFYPHARVTTLIPIFFILQLIVVPAPIFLGIWFVIQLFQGTFALGGTEAAGVAWWAHAGGFAFGFALAWMLGRAPGTQQPRIRVVRL